MTTNLSNVFSPAKNEIASKLRKKMVLDFIWNVLSAYVPPIIDKNKFMDSIISPDLLYENFSRKVWESYRYCREKL